MKHAGAEQQSQIPFQTERRVAEQAHVDTGRQTRYPVKPGKMRRACGIRAERRGRRAERADDVVARAHVGEKRARTIDVRTSDLRFERDKVDGSPHLQALYTHWRPDAGWQREDQFSDGTLRLLGMMWSLLEINIGMI